MDNIQYIKDVCVLHETMQRTLELKKVTRRNFKTAFTTADELELEDAWTRYP